MLLPFSLVSSNLKWSVFYEVFSLSTFIYIYIYIYMNAFFKNTFNS